MQLTKFIALLAATAATTVNAAPGAPLEERQATIAYLRFYAGSGCEEPWLEDTVFQQGNKCLSNTYTAPYGSFFIRDNYFTRTSKSEDYRSSKIITG